LRANCAPLRFDTLSSVIFSVRRKEPVNIGDLSVSVELCKIRASPIPAAILPRMEMSLWHSLLQTEVQISRYNWSRHAVVDHRVGIIAPVPPPRLALVCNVKPVTERGHETMTLFPTEVMVRNGAPGVCTA
jgi:hypothetical protein